MRQSVSITGRVPPVGRLVGFTHSFDDPHVAPYWPNTCRTIIDKTSLRLHSFYFFMNNILIGLIFNKSVCVKKQFTFDFTSFNYLKQFYLQYITPVRMVIAPKIQFFSLLLFAFELCCLFPNQSKFMSKLKSFSKAMQWRNSHVLNCFHSEMICF